MPNNTLIKCMADLRGKPHQKQFTFQTLVGQKFHILEKILKGIDVLNEAFDYDKKEWVALEEQLTEDELDMIYSKFDYLAPIDLPDEPDPVDIEMVKADFEGETPISEMSVNEILDDAAGSEETDKPLEELSLEELKAICKEKEIDFDGRKRKQEYFIELIQQHG